ncbi:probable aldo/keto reductase family proteins [Rhynchosporium agropyri]|uniref:Probable aldo/keto reductase family proteins n=1 Tax=Rhynchosporium agropyri TaxID=914238 RepID=A0A1E1KNW8_9HELO|nr:probable aldo/keto reductase family proteins [Rhynchosporium agropyri]
MAAKLSVKDVLALPNSSVKIPRIGFGVYLSPNKTCINSCLTALKAGYRHIDSAQYYENEQDVGDAVRQSGIPRSEVFITTKIIAAAGSVDKTYEQLLGSIEKIDGRDGYVDLFMIHTASGGSKNRKEMYLALEKLLESGKTKAIGVSNWGIGHIEELKSFAKVYPPHVLQIELHPFNQQREVVDFAHKNGIIVEAYCPLVRNQKADDPTLTSIAKAHDKTTSHVLIRYCLQKNWVPLPKSDTPSRIEENVNVYDFELSKEEMTKLDSLDQGSAGAIVQAVTNTL